MTFIREYEFKTHQISTVKYGLFKPDTFNAVINTTTQINSAPGQNLDNSITSHVSKPIAAEHKLITVELVDKFIDLYLNEMKLFYQASIRCYQQLLMLFSKKQNPEIYGKSNEKHLVEIHLSWPEFFKNFKIHVHAKPRFSNTIRMERIIKIL